MRFELTTPTLARLCSTPELRPHRRNFQGIRYFMHHRHDFDKPYPAAISGVGNLVQKPHFNSKRIFHGHYSHGAGGKRGRHNR